MRIRKHSSLFVDMSCWGVTPSQSHLAWCVRQRFPWPCACRSSATSLQWTPDCKQQSQCCTTVHNTCHLHACTHTPSHALPVRSPYCT